MTGEKKHRSFKELLRGGATPALLHPHQSPTESLLSVGSHRFFLRKRNSKSSVTSSSASSINSNNDTASLSIHPSERIRSSDSAQLLHLVSHHEDKKKLKKKEKKEKRRGLGGSSSHHLLKRFFKILHPGDHATNTPNMPAPVLPLSSSAALASKYDLGDLIGSGASGSVNLVSDKYDPKKIYAVKKFRAKLRGEGDNDYMTKVKNEFLIGDHLLHQNLIHTIELIRDLTPSSDGVEYYIVMEYCPYDFFNLVMSGLMTKEEIYCYTKQIINGVHHLHMAGVAHRDLKLDNCVVDANGVLKIIDFGSAFQFKKHIDKSKPRIQQVLLDHEHRLVLAKGIVGSDPYLSPEVFESGQISGYDARLADVWSIAIIFCCMLLKRFPWKVPRSSDPSYRAFAGSNSQDEHVSDHEKVTSSMSDLSTKDAPPKYGPERLLRLLPRASRPLIQGMLQIDPTKRYYIEDVLDDPFYKSIEVCHYIVASEEDEYGMATQEVNSSSQVDTSTLGEISAASAIESAQQDSTGSIPDSSAETDVTNINAPQDSAIQAPGIQTSDVSIDGSTMVSEDNSLYATENGGVAAHEVAVHAVGAFVKSLNHVHHLVTEKELEKINAEREAARRMQKNGMT